MDIGLVPNENLKKNAYIFEYDGKDWKEPIKGISILAYQNEENHFDFSVCYITPKKNKIWLIGRYNTAMVSEIIIKNNVVCFMSKRHTPIDFDEEIPLDTMATIDAKEPQELVIINHENIFEHCVIGTRNKIPYSDEYLNSCTQLIINEMKKRDGEFYTTITLYKKKRTIENVYNKMEELHNKVAKIESMLQQVFTRKEIASEFIDCLNSLHGLPSIK